MTEPTFVSKPGQIDYTHEKRAPVVNTLIRYRGENKYLLIKRSSGLRLHPDLWNGISGFLDDKQSVEEKIRSEICEETGLADSNILIIVPGKPFEQDDREHDKVWEVHPALVVLDTQAIAFNWEGQEYVWVPLHKIRTYDLVPGYEKVIAACQHLPVGRGRIDAPTCFH